MRIKKLSVWSVPLTSHATYYMADGKTCDTVLSHVLCLETDEGLKGWGEVCPIPHYLPAYAGGVVPALAEMAPLILGASFDAPQAMMHRLDAHLMGHVYAKSIIDLALWDLMGQKVDLPLYSLLGGRINKDLPLYHSITCVEPEEMARMAQEARAEGITQFQVKLGADNDWEKDVARMRLVREAVGPRFLVYGDWNCGSTQLDAIRVARALNDIDVMLEQPCATLEQCAQVRHATGVPMKIDENAHDIASLLHAHELKCMDAAALKLSKFGGLSTMIRARDLCLHLGVKMCIEDTWGSDLVTSASVHLAAATPHRYVLNTCDLSGYVGPRLDEKGPMRNNGRIAPSDAPGLGISPDPDFLGQAEAIFD